MKKRDPWKTVVARAGLSSTLIAGLVLGSGAFSCYAMAKMQGTASEESKKETTDETRETARARQGAVSGNPAPGTPSPVGQNAEKLLFTLNDTLAENRKIRESLHDLQNAFEKMAIEKSDLADQVRKVEKLAIQRNKDVSRDMDQLNAQLDQSRKELVKLQADNKAAVDQKMELEKKLKALSAENARSQEKLKAAILPAERDKVVARMDQNDAAVRNAVTQISSLDGENIALKEQVIQSYFDLGNMFYDLGRYQEAVAQYLHVLEWNPNHAWAHHNLAVIYDYHFHWVSEAITQYRAYMHVKLASDEAREARMRLWDLEQLKTISPPPPLKKDFKDYQKTYP
jgi:tetratricopeptide (TPR) repeat protein